MPHWKPLPPGLLTAAMTSPMTGSQPAKCPASAAGSPGADHDSRTEVSDWTNPT